MSTAPKEQFELPKFKALSLWQPWADLLATGLKQYETRSWSTTHRGWVWIHAAKRWQGDQRWILEQEHYADAYKQLTRRSEPVLKLGCLLGVAWLHNCLRIDEGWPELLTDRELAFGDFRPGRYAWEFSEVRRLPEPLEFRGEQGLFEITGRPVWFAAHQLGLEDLDVEDLYPMVNCRRSRDLAKNGARRKKEVRRG